MASKRESGEGVQDSVSGTSVEFKGTPGPFLPTILMMLLWLGSVHFIALVVLFSFVLPPTSESIGSVFVRFSVIVLLLVLIVIPIDSKNKWGIKLCGYICKRAVGYFPLSMHVEDIKAFDPNKAYVFEYEPHSVWPFGVVALAELTGFMPLKKLKSSPAVLGVQEAVYMEHGSEVAFIQNRHGFVRIAMENVKPLVPVFCFGQSDAFKWWKPSGKLYMSFSQVLRSPVPFTQPVVFFRLFNSTKTIFW